LLVQTIWNFWTACIGIAGMVIGALKAMG
jgi:hypothetical protein